MSVCFRGVRAEQTQGKERPPHSWKSSASQKETEFLCDVGSPVDVSSERLAPQALALKRTASSVGCKIKINNTQPKRAGVKSAALEEAAAVTERILPPRQGSDDRPESDQNNSSHVSLR